MSLAFDSALRYKILSLDNERWVAGWERKVKKEDEGAEDRLLVRICMMASNPCCHLLQAFRKDLGLWGKWIETIKEEF